jgi:serine/threonine protein kinase
MAAEEEEDDEAAEHEKLVGRVLAGKLELQKVLGAGAMGVVYLARHTSLDTVVAIKVLRSEAKGDATRAKRFESEAKAAARLRHPNSVQILDFGQDGPDGLLYICMEFLQGEDLQAVLRREGRLGPERGCKIMMQVLGALAAAHEHGVIHRDLKPGNVMLMSRKDDDGSIEDEVKVCDFGLAKILDASLTDAQGAPLTKQGTIFGTPAYMSPEQARGDVLDARSDLYSCGVIMYKMFTGEALFSSDTAWGLLMKHLTEPPIPPRQIVPALDEELEKIILKSLAKNPADRFQSARELRSAIKAYLRDVSPDDAIAATGSRQRAIPRTESDIEMAAQPTAKLSSVPPDQGEVSKTFIPNASPLQTMPPKDVPAWQEESRGPPPPKQSKMPIVIGGLALVAFLGGLTVFGLGREPEVKPLPSKPEPLPIAAPAEPKAAPAPKPAEVAPPAEPAPEAVASDPEPVKKEKRSKRSTIREESSALKEARTELPKVEEPKPPVIEQPKVETPPPAPPPPPPPIAEVKPPPPEQPKPDGPKKLSSSFDLDLGLERVKIGGGVSTRRTEDALMRYMSPVKDCLKKAVASLGVEASGSVEVKGMVDVQGRVRKLEAKGGPSSAAACVEGALGSAQVPKPDTGDTALSFAITYRTK